MVKNVSGRRLLLSPHNREKEFNMRACPEAANHIVLMFIDYDVHLHIFIFFMIIFFNREEEFNMRACPEAANHSRYLAWDMQVLEELAFLVTLVHNVVMSPNHHHFM